MQITFFLAENDIFFFEIDGSEQMQNAWREKKCMVMSFEMTK